MCQCSLGVCQVSGVGVDVTGMRTAHEFTPVFGRIEAELHLEVFSMSPREAPGLDEAVQLAEGESQILVEGGGVMREAERPPLGGLLDVEDHRGDVWLHVDQKSAWPQPAVRFPQGVADALTRDSS